jgi:hypothetical protein
MINTKIVEILENFGISSKKASEIMGMTPSAFGMKKAELNGNRFKEENLNVLIKFIKDESKKIKTPLDQI